MSLTLEEARQVLADQLDTTLDWLRASPQVPSQINPPAAVVAPNTSDLADYEQVLSSDIVMWYLRVVLIVGRVNDQAAQSLMDEMISATGPKSVVHAIHQDMTLGGQVEWAVVKTAQRYGNMTYNGVDYLGCELVVEVSC